MLQLVVLHVELIGIINKPLLLRVVDCLYYFYQGTFCLQNVAPFHGTRVNVTSYTAAREVRHFPALLVTGLACNQQCCVQNCRTEFDTNKEMCVENVGEKCVCRKCGENTLPVFTAPIFRKRVTTTNCCGRRFGVASVQFARSRRKGRAKMYSRAEVMRVFSCRGFFYGNHQLLSGT